MLEQEKPPHSPTVALPGTAAPYSSLPLISCCESPVNVLAPWSVRAAVEPFLKARFIAFHHMPQVHRASLPCESAHSQRLVVFASADVTRLLIRCAGVFAQSQCEKANIVERTAAGSLGHRRCRLAVHLLCCCICLIMHVNTVEMHSPADQ